MNKTDNKMGYEGACALSEALINQRSQRWTCGACRGLTIPSMQTILTGRNKTGNEIRAEGAHTLSEAMKTNTALTQLGFEH